jgi:hypothetical protein
MAGKDKVLMKSPIQKPDGIEKVLQIRGEVLVPILKKRGMDAGVAFYAQERIVLFNRHAQSGVSGQQPAGNEIKPATEEK